MKNIPIVWALSVLSIACTNVPKHKSIVVDQQKAESVSPQSQPLPVKGVGAVFYSPDSIDVENLKSKLGEEIFYQIADDNNYYHSEAMKELEKNGISVVATDNRYIEFHKDNGQISIIDKGSLGSVRYITFTYAGFAMSCFSGETTKYIIPKERQSKPLFFVLRSTKPVIIEFVKATCSIRHLKSYEMPVLSRLMPEKGLSQKTAVISM